MSIRKIAGGERMLYRFLVAYFLVMPAALILIGSLQWAGRLPVFLDIPPLSFVLTGLAALVPAWRVIAYPEYWR